MTQGTSTPHRAAPSGVVEILRVLVVVFFAGVGYEVTRLLDVDTTALGPFNGVAVGVIVGSGLGYVIGGVVGRTAIGAVARTEVALREVSAEQLVAGAFGGVVGVLVGAGVAWPVFLINEPFLAFPLFGVVVAILGLLGYRVGAGKREEVLVMFGHHAGMGRPSVAVSSQPRILDSSVAIDGRIVEVVRAGFLHGTMLVAPAVLAELQGLADAGDDLRRAKGRRGLEVLETLRREPGVVVEVIDDQAVGVHEVDAKLVRICLDRSAPLLTLDTNLAKVASLSGVRVLNLHALTLAVRPKVAAGDDVAVLLIKAGREPGQAVGYLDDGTMVVAEQSRDMLGNEVRLRVTSVLTTANGRMVFARSADSVDADSGAIR